MVRMGRTYTSSGDQEPILMSASRSTIRGRVRVEVEPEVGMLFKGMCGDGCGGWTISGSQYSPLGASRYLASYVSTSRWDGSGGNLACHSDASQTRVGGQTPDPIVAPDSQIPKTQPSVVIIPIRLGVSQVIISGVPFQKVREVKRARHSGDYGGSPPKSRGYFGRGYHSQSSRPIYVTIPMSEAGYTGHSSLSLVHTSQGSSSRPVGHGGHSNHSGSSHQPRSHSGCFECGDMGHFASTFRVAQPPTRGGVQTGKGGSHFGKGDSPSGRGGGREGS
ncbi:hypothetical protein H5410_022562 [Solanum commersonii]|uniref:CCHC-type domain-containing protein n=1 Tax=Solanum commersonii TaxID=4109 RepID=A0A9J5ZEG8_SOLCO|nr:hypothetical protein H5410_022562 [Solanum commersonii]